MLKILCSITWHQLPKNGDWSFKDSMFPLGPRNIFCKQMTNFTNLPMAMGLFLFYHEDWKQIFYQNCTIHEFNVHSNIPVGMIYVTIGLCAELFYIPFIIVMAKQEFMNMSCYQFMLLLGIIDMMTLPTVIAYGLQGMLGAHYCSAPHILYILGCTATAGWFAATSTSTLLATDRFFSFIFPRVGDVLFGKKMMKVWLTLPVVYGLYAWFTINSAFFNPDHMGLQYLGPFYGDNNFKSNYEFYDNRMLVINSYIMVPTLAFSYLMICIWMFIKTNIIKTASITKLQRITFYQSICICWEFLFVATVYLSNVIGLFIPPDWFYVIENICWILIHADTPVVYMMFNGTLRKAVLSYIKDIFVAAGKPMAMISTIYRPGSRVAPSSTIENTTSVPQPFPTNS